MKTAISIPDDTFAAIERSVAELGVSRSEFFARAARLYLDKLESESITRQMDEALAAEAADGICDDSNEVAAAAGRRFLANLDDDW